MRRSRITPRIEISVIRRAGRSKSEFVRISHLTNAGLRDFEIEPFLKAHTKYMHEAGEYPRDDSEIRKLLAEMQECLVGDIRAPSGAKRGSPRRIRTMCQAANRRYAGRFLPKSTMGKAVSYALAQWRSLEVYLKEPGIEIDTHLVEQDAKESP